jgi:hypothetical protein
MSAYRASARVFSVEWHCPLCGQAQSFRHILGPDGTWPNKWDDKVCTFCGHAQDLPSRGCQMIPVDEGGAALAGGIDVSTVEPARRSSPPIRFAVGINTFFRPLMALFGAWKGRAFVELQDRRLHVRFGMFDQTFSFDDIAEIVPLDSWSWYNGLGLRLTLSGDVALIGSTKGIVEIRFRTPQTMRMLIELASEKLFVSLENRDGFLAVYQHAVGAG